MSEESTCEASEGQEDTTCPFCNDEHLTPEEAKHLRTVKENYKVLMERYKREQAVKKELEEKGMDPLKHGKESPMVPIGEDVDPSLSLSGPVAREIVGRGWTARSSLLGNPRYRPF